MRAVRADDARGAVTGSAVVDDGRAVGDREIRRALLAVLVARTAVNGGARVVFPFLPEIARGLDVSLATVGTLVAGRALLSACAPAVARVAEHVGRRALMLAGVVATLVGSVVIGVAPGIGVAAVGFAIVGVAKPSFDVPMQGWFGAHVPYARRGRVLGLAELTWGLGLLATVPVSGFLIERYGWRAQFAVVAVLSAAGCVAVLRLFAPDRPQVRVRQPLVLDGRRVRVLAAVLLFATAAESLFVVYGAWLEDAIGLDVAAIGVFTLIVVASELAGEGAVAAFGDRVGLRRGVVVALLLGGVAYVGLGFVGSSLAGAIVVVVGWFVFYEMSIVGTIPFLGELGGAGRDRLLGLMFVMLAVARAGGSIVAPRLYESGGIRPVGLLAAGCVLAAAALLASVDDPAPPPDVPRTRS